MQENTNRAIAYNSIILYGKLAISTICALLTTRFALQALGVVDFGLYAVLGGIISFISIFNTIMLSTSNRFIAVAIGKGDINEANKQFNVNLVVHIFIALLAIVLALPIGEWYIPRYVNYDGPLSNAIMVFSISIVGSILSFVGVPYNGLLMAKEKFIVFSLVDVVSHILKLVVAWILVYYFENKLLIYTITMAFLTAMHTIIYISYCSRNYPDIVKFKVVKDKAMYKNVFGFSSWVAVGAVASVGKSQGASLIVNTFFNTIMNTAMGVASSVNAYICMFANAVTQPMQPQITKSFAAGDKNRTNELLIMSTKFSFLLMLLIGSIFLVSPEWILGLWLGDVPPYATIFLILFVVDSLVQSFNAGISNIIWASGKIALYQILTSTLNILAVVAGYFVLKVGYPAYYLIGAYISFSVLRFFAVQWSLHKTLDYNNFTLWKFSYLPSILVVILFLPMLFVPDIFHPFIKLIISFGYLCGLEYFIGLSKNERKQLLGLINSKLKRGK